MAEKNDGLGGLIIGIVALGVILAVVAATLSVGLVLLGGVASAGVGRGIFVGLANFGSVFAEAHRKLP